MSATRPRDEDEHTGAPSPKRAKLDDGEQEAGVRCVAVPVPGGLVAGAISVSGPAGRLGLDAVPRVVPLLQSAAAALATELGRDGDRPER